MIKERTPHPPETTRDEEREEPAAAPSPRGLPPDFESMSNSQRAAFARRKRGGGSEASARPRRGGAGLPDRAGFEEQFGESFADVTVHEGEGVAEDHDALAVAVGEAIHVSGGALDPESPEGRFLLGHELAHVIQQRGSGDEAAAQVQAKSTGPTTGDAALEREADEVGQLVAAGESVAGAVSGRVARGTVQRFGAKEHERMGNLGSHKRAGTIKLGNKELPVHKNQMVKLAPDYEITFGQMVALGGDHFESVDQMRAFAKNTSGGAESRGEIEFALEWKLGKYGAKYDADAKKAQKKRYYDLAGENMRHFVNPGKGDNKRSTADKAGDVTRIQLVKPGTWDLEWVSIPDNSVAAYRLGHTQAVMEAAEAGATGGALEEALAADGFACHFLTDSFSAGHVRTPRWDARQYWNQKVPMFFYNLIGYMSQQITRTLRSKFSDVDAPIDNFPDIEYGHLTEQIVWEKTKGKVSGALSKMGRIDFGDLVGLAMHDYDNEEGVHATVEGKLTKLYGDGEAGKHVDGHEQELAVKAVQRSVLDVQMAYALGASMKPKEVAKKLMGGGLYSAEKMIPVLSDQTDSMFNKQIKWKFDDPTTLIRHGDFQKALKVFAADKATEVASVAGDFDKTQQKALRISVVEPLKSDPAQQVMNVVHWTPNTGGGVSGHDTDDNAMDYFGEAKKTKGGLESLTYVQRINLINDLMAGLKVWDDEEEGIWAILDTASVSDARKVISKVGWEKIADALEGAEDTKFRRKFPKATYG